MKIKKRKKAMRQKFWRKTDVILCVPPDAKVIIENLPDPTPHIVKDIVE